MHDINTINRLNAEAHAKSVTRWRAEGNFVVTIHEGLSLVSAAPYGTKELAESVAAANREVNTGRTVTVLEPTGNHHSLQRDQSEDRKQPYTLEELAALGRTGEDKTLGNYIERKQSQLSAYEASRNAHA